MKSIKHRNAIYSTKDVVNENKCDVRSGKANEVKGKVGSNLRGKFIWL